ncbi:MAG: hypothetical protein MH252_12095 [Thermosynechococcaceae cyanobacterium MS004]|nr:hypothetical protein [Thermosynechococcaceae cyanobacterium MS004]
MQIDQLPLVLAGPILRRTEPRAVTVWLALQEACNVCLTVQETTQQGEQVSDRILLKGQGTSTRLGQNLHVVAVTAYPHLQQQLQPDTLYAYDLTFAPEPSPNELGHPEGFKAQTPIQLSSALQTPAFSSPPISYFSHGLPTFALSPSDLCHLKIFHGSCRCIHDRESDALPILDLAIADNACSPLSRPHQLFFTGDQIYGDEVAEPFLWAILQLMPILFGWQEILLNGAGLPLPQTQLQPGQRQAIAEQLAGFTASRQGKPEKTRSHLLRFAEYATAYLFAWSDSLWHFPFPSSVTMGLTGKAAQEWDKQVQHISQFARSQPYVRRVLANIPTYMIFDDHDVSDDWNLNQAWCLQVLGKPLGRQVVQNALLAYALFQAWGNTPDQFQGDEPGAQLLRSTQQWCLSQGQCQDSAQQLSQVLGLPPRNPVTGFPRLRHEEGVVSLDRSPHAIQWHYRVRGTRHEVLVLDTRTQRGYPIGEALDALPQLLSPRGFEQQLKPMLGVAAQEIQQADTLLPTQLTFVVAPTNIFSLKVLDQVQTLGHFQGKTFDIDIGDSWTLERSTRARLLAHLLESRQSVIVLSGDIHFSGAIHVDYWSHRGETEPLLSTQHQKGQQARKRTLVQFTASALCNSDSLTEILHTRIKSLWPERPHHWIGWEDSEEIEVGLGWCSALSRFFGYLLSSLTCLLPGSRHKASRPKRPRRPPDWQYETYWVRRQAAQTPLWGIAPPWKSYHDENIKTRRQSWMQQRWMQQLWRSRWFQEGKEVIGLNNIGLVRLEQSTSDRSPQESLPDIAVHELFWYAPWSKVPTVVSSQFRTNLRNSPFKRSG